MSHFFRNRWTLPFAALLVILLAACGGGGGSTAVNPGGGTGVAPSFSSQPAPLTVRAGQSAQFAAVATGTPEPSEQWERSSDGSTWSAVAGATGTSYAFNAAKTDHGAQFRARATNSAGSATSNSAALTVQWPPNITSHPASQSVASPNPAVFSMNMDCNPDGTVQWQSSMDGSTWADIPGASAHSYSTGPTSLAMNHLQFRCVCANAVGSATSNAATLSVDAPSFTLSVNLGTGTIGTPPATASYTQGSTVNYAYSAAAGYTNLVVLLDGSATAATGTITMDGAHTLAASATPIPRTVTFTAGSGGAVTGTLTQVVSNGSSTTPVTAVADAGYTFVNWTGAGFTTSTANPLVVGNVLQDLSITAHFAPAAATYTITASAGIYGNISPSGAVTVPAGGNLTFTITPDAYYSIVDVKVDGVSVGAVDSYTFTNVSANHTISATFY